MFIKKLVLNNYKRFSLKGIKHYEFIPRSNVNIFTWNNGVGKSSLLSQLNPLPIDFKKDFLENGYKILEFSHLGSEYVVTSKDNKHSILKDGVELNQGGTKRVQLELIESIFKINPNNLNVINGNHCFSIMTPSERKKWLTDISVVDYSYPISVYIKLLDRKKELTAWIKLVSEKTLEINSFLNSIKNYEELKQTDSSIKNLIEILLKEYKVIKEEKSIEDLIRLLNMKTIEFNNLSYVLQKDIITLKEEEKKLETNIEVKKNEINNILKRLDSLLKDGDKEMLNQLQEELKEIKSKLTIKPKEWTLSNLEDIFYHLQNKETFLYSLKEELTNNTLEANQEQLENDIISKKLLISKIEDAINTHSKLHNTFSSIVDIKLPSCSHCGNPYDVNSSLDQTNKNIKLLKDRLELEKSNLSNLEKTLRLYLKKKYLLEQYKSIITTDEYLKTSLSLNSYTPPIKPSLDDINVILENIAIVLGYIKDIFIPYLTKEESINKQLIPLLEHDLLDKDSKNKTIELLQKQYELLQDNKLSLDKSLQLVKEDINNFNKLSNIRDEIKSILSSISKENKNTRIKEENNFIENSVNALKEKALENYKNIEKYNSYLSQLQQLNKEKELYQEELEHIVYLLDVLSPNTGLIAKSINSFLGVFLQEMNSIINSVWSYKMKLLPCDLSEGDDLDYKFKVEVNDDFIVEDISKLSSSMREIVDLSFRLIYLKYKNIPQMPIILDEFGRTMDRDHRINAFNMIDQIICSNFDQIFLVSHFEEMYGRFKNAYFPTLEEIKGEENE